MASLELLVKTISTGIWEMGEAFTGLPDADVWRRAHPRLLSVGELAAHTAYGEASWFQGESRTDSPLFYEGVEYYPDAIARPFSLDMSAAAVYAEVKRIHEACLIAWNGNPQDSETPYPGRDGWTWGSVLEYQAFHLGYHTGQIYSVRHLLGHETVDN